MDIKKAIGRPTKINMRTVTKLADAIAHNTNITDSCRFVGISRTSYYRHLNRNPVFAEKMINAMVNRDKAIFSFVTTY